MIVGIVSGGFDPLHVGHVRMLNTAKVYSDKVIVILNSDAWLSRKKGRPFMPFKERMEVLNSLRAVDEVIPVDDETGDVTSGLENLRQREMLLPGNRLVFLNGGDRINTNTPEALYCRKNDITLVWHAGGGKVQSSSWLTNPEG